MTAIIISITASVLSGGLLFLFQRYFKQKDKRDETRDLTLAKENILILKSLNCVGKLAYASALAIKGNKIDGEMDDAMKSYGEINKELYEYLLEQNSRK